MRIEPRDRGRRALDLRVRRRPACRGSPAAADSTATPCRRRSRRACRRRRPRDTAAPARRPARADHQHARAAERRLAGAADLAQHDVAGIAFEFLGRQHRTASCSSASLAHRGVSARVRHFAVEVRMRVSAAILAVILGARRRSPRAIRGPMPRAEAATPPPKRKAEPNEAGAKEAAKPKPERQPDAKPRRGRAAAKPKSKSREPSPRPAAAPPPASRSPRACRTPMRRSRSPTAWRSRTISPGAATTPARSTANSASGWSQAVKAYPEAAQESGHRRDEPGGAHGARRRRRAAQAARSAGGSPRIR